MRKSPTVAVLSDQVLFRRAICGFLRAQHARVFEYASVADVRRAPVPDVLVVDLDHEREDTMTLVRGIRRDFPGTRLVVIGSALRSGAADSTIDGDVETPSADIPALLAATQLGRPLRRSSEARRQQRLWSEVTPRQRDVLRWLSTGADNATIARKLRVGLRAIKAHVTALLNAFSVANRTQLALLADRAGLHPPNGARA
jgi:DNA-binding NarL/FixJ family response regulator